MWEKMILLDLMISMVVMFKFYISADLDMIFKNTLLRNEI